MEDPSSGMRISGLSSLTMTARSLNRSRQSRGRKAFPAEYAERSGRRTDVARLRRIDRVARGRKDQGSRQCGRTDYQSFEKHGKGVTHAGRQTDLLLAAGRGRQKRIQHPAAFSVRVYRSGER